MKNSKFDELERKPSDACIFEKLGKIVADLKIRM